MIPHEYWFSDISCDGGDVVGVPLQVMRRGTIKKLRVLQLDGQNQGFNYCLYNTVAACQADGSALAGVSEKLFRISPILTVSSGNDQYASDEGFPEDGVSNLDLAYECLDDHDGNPLRRTPSNASDKIYLRLAAAGTGSKLFGVAMTIMDPMI